MAACASLALKTVPAEELTHGTVVVDAIVDSREVDVRTVTGGASYRAVDAFSASDCIARITGVRSHPKSTYRTRHATTAAVKHKI